MSRNLFISASLLAISTLSFNVHAALDNTLSVGYAHSSIKVSDDKFDDNPKGINFKYNHEFDNDWGVIGSLTYTKLTYNYYGRWGKIGSTEIDYVSLTAGPSYRFNDYFSAYGLIGLGHVNQDDKFYYSNDEYSKTSMAYGLGLQVNPIPNVAIDASYEYSKFDDAKFGTWVLGVGYRF
ncbi:MULTISPECIES: Ail/Lom family outer membrane beta-barrel protein [Proteus]|uniref:Ail/Lom family outer membrane beta-barrel protein n=1 Tax=Proteus TaxID=583 RepID=UPI00200B445B|nr:Ail/Lom family outer membrane beta-barrel protein [Proteus columbae]MCK9782685.1 outer membrane beta-barrel protein [Proteus columbae]